MRPAPGPPPGDAQVRALLGAFLAAHHGADSKGLERAWSHFESLSDRIPDAGVRAGLAALVGTAGEPALEHFVAGTGPVSSVRYGSPITPGRVVGPAGNGDDPAARVVNERYRSEHFALLAPSLVHGLCWTGPGAGHAEEAALHAVLALVHMQLLARTPAIALLGTELARRQNSLAITLCNSRHPGEARISVCAPDGPGTIPGGNPAMQTSDFWSVPFASPSADGEPIGEPARAVLSGLADSGGVQQHGFYDDVLGEWLSLHLGRGALPLAVQARAATALGLVDSVASAKDA